MANHSAIANNFGRNSESAFRLHPTNISGVSPQVVAVGSVCSEGLGTPAEAGGRKLRLLFVSPVFLLPSDTGGKIRTGNILRGLKGGAFEVALLCPVDSGLVEQYPERCRDLADSFRHWSPRRARPRWIRAVDALRDLPINVVADRTRSAMDAVARTLSSERFDVVVFDFVHSAVLKPQHIDAASVCFTHNVEAEIFARHALQASNFLMRQLWQQQFAKMRRFESTALPAFDTVVAVSERDASHFEKNYGVIEPAVIPTGVDLDFFEWQAPQAIRPDSTPTVVFTGSMDWAANIDGIEHFLAQTWPLVLREVPRARICVVGRNPPTRLVERARQDPSVTITGYVDDVRPYVRAAHVFVIPLRVGGGTRIKAFEAMAMGCPVVSTAIGIEGLSVIPDEHFLLCDQAEEQARAIVQLMRDQTLRERLSNQARRYVEQHFGHQQVARVFEQACLRAIERRQTGHAAVALRGLDS